MLREDFIKYLHSNLCEIFSDGSRKHSIYVNTMNKSLRSAVLKNERLSERYISNVCRCLGISIPVEIQIKGE